MFIITCMYRPNYILYQVKLNMEAASLYTLTSSHRFTIGITWVRVYVQVCTFSHQSLFWRSTTITWKMAHTCSRPHLVHTQQFEIRPVLHKPPPPQRSFNTSYLWWAYCAKREVWREVKLFGFFFNLARCCRQSLLQKRDCNTVSWHQPDCLFLLI